MHVGDIFDISTLNEERERITADLKSRGYYNFSVNNIEYLADTLRSDRTVGLKMVVKQELTGYDERGEAVMEDNTVYRIDRIRVFPRYNPTEAYSDSLYLERLDTVRYRGLDIVYEGKPNLRPRVVRDMIPIYDNMLYNSSRITRTYDKLMSSGYFKSARIVFEESARQVDLVDTLTVERAHRKDTTFVRRSKEGFCTATSSARPPSSRASRWSWRGASRRASTASRPRSAIRTATSSAAPKRSIWPSRRVMSTCAPPMPRNGAPWSSDSPAD